MVCRRRTQQTRDDGYGEAQRKVRGEVAATRREQRIEQLVDPLGDLPFEQLHRSGGEAGLQDLAQLAVTRRIGVEETARPEMGVVDVDALGARERPPVAAGRLHVGEPGEHPE